MTTSLLVATTLRRREGVLAARALPCLGFPALLWPAVLVAWEPLLPLVPEPLVEVLVMPVEVLVPPEGVGAACGAGGRRAAMVPAPPSDADSTKA